MSERRIVHVDITHRITTGHLRLYEAGRIYALPRVVAQ